jgi:hypothetical protein
LVSGSSMSDGFLNTTTTVATELALIPWHSPQTLFYGEGLLFSGTPIAPYGRSLAAFPCRFGH